MDFLIRTEVLDTAIEDVRNKKQQIASEMNYLTRLMSEVQLMEKAAEKAKQEFDNCNLVILEEIDELILAQQQAKEANDQRAREVYAQKIKLATEMSELQFRVSDVLKGGDGCVASIDEICESLENRLTSAVIKKEAADKERLELEVTLAYQKSQMEKLAQESKKLEQEAKENLKMQKFLVDRGHVVNMLLEEITYKCQDVLMLKMELGNSQDEKETEDYLRPIMQELTQIQDYEWWIKDSDFTQELAYSHVDQLNKNKRSRNGSTLHMYEKSKMEKLEEELKKLEQEATDDVKLQEFLLELEGYQNEIKKLVTSDYLKPIITSEGDDGRNVAGREKKITNKTVNSKHVFSKSEMEKLGEVSKRLEEEAMDNFKVVISSGYNEEIEDYLDEIAKLVTEDYFMY